MKKTNKFIIVPLVFSVTACVSTSTKESSRLPKSVLADGGGGRGQGGNPEVNLNRCFGLKSKERQSCFDIFYPNDINLSIYPSSGEVIRLAGRKSSVEKGEFNLKDKERFIFSVNTSNVKLPIRCNIKSAKLLQAKESLVVDVATREIKNNITLTDREGKVILNYSIRK